MSSFEGLSSTLTRAGAPLRASEVHGMLSALVCVPGGSRVAMLQGEVLGEEIDEPDSAECRQALETAWRATSDALDSEDLGFDLLLPDDEQPIAQRTAALGEWCTGFLAGLGLAGVAEHVDAFSDDAQEFMSDLREMSRIDADSDGDEEAETAYVELVEYLRVGVMLLREELVALGDKAAMGRLH